MSDDTETCPRCGTELGDAESAPCLCPTCGARICEGGV